MKTSVNSEIIEMAPEQEQEYLRWKAEQEEYERLHPVPPTTEERIAALEREIFELKGGTI